MRPGTVVGALLILLGVIVLSVGGFSFTRREKVAEVGPIEATAERERSVPLPPIVGGLAIAGGLLVLVASARRAR